jgi:hypothetical protein
VIGETIQLSLAPAFLLVATSGILNVVTGRLARVVDRARNLIAQHKDTVGEEHDRVVAELRLLDRRMDIINWSVGLAVACGITVCLMVAMLFFVGAGHIDLGLSVSAAFIVAMTLLLGSLLLFLIEVRLAIRTIHVPMELLEK